MHYVELIGGLKENIDIYLIALLSIVLVANIIDFGFGWVNARFNKNVVFESNIALYGIIKKMMYFIVLILFTIIALAVIPHEIAIPSITALYLGYLLSEVNSILSHLDLTSDGKTGELFRTFISRILKGENR